MEAKYEYYESRLFQEKKVLQSGEVEGENSNALVRRAKGRVGWGGIRCRRDDTLLHPENGKTKIFEIVLYPYHLGRGHILRLYDIKE